MREADPAKKYAKGIATQEDLVNATIHCICKQGYHAASVTDIVNRAQLSKNQFFHHFGSKEQAGVKAVVRCHSAWQSEVLAPAELYPDSQARLLELNDRLAELSASDWPHLKLLAMLVGESDSLPDVMQQALRELLDELLTVLRRNFKEFKKQADVTLTPKARVMATLTLSFWLGNIGLNAVGSDYAEFETALRGYLELTQLAN